MKRPVVAPVTAAIALAAIAFPSWAVLTYRPPAQTPVRKIPTVSQLVEFQTLAESACRCTRKRKEDRWDSPCWDDFDKRIAPFDPQEAVAACGAEARSVCFGDSPEICLSIERSPYGLCGAEERRISDTIWADAHVGAKTAAQRLRADARANAAIARAIESFDRGEKIIIPATMPTPASPGC